MLWWFEGFPLVSYSSTYYWAWKLYLVLSPVAYIYLLEEEIKVESSGVLSHTWVSLTMLSQALPMREEAPPAGSTFELTCGYNVLHPIWYVKSKHFFFKFAAKASTKGKHFVLPEANWVESASPLPSRNGLMLIQGPGEPRAIPSGFCVYFLTATGSSQPLPSAVCCHLVTIKITSQFGLWGSDNAQAPC